LGVFSFPKKEKIRPNCFSLVDNLGVPLTTFGSPPYGLRFARCFARFAPPGGSRKNLLTEGKKMKNEK
jgi:hypothetical protein